MKSCGSLIFLEPATRYSLIGASTRNIKGSYVKISRDIRYEIPTDGLLPKEEKNSATLDWADLVEISRSRNLYE